MDIRFYKDNLGRNYWFYKISRVITIFGNRCGEFAFAWWVLDGENAVYRMASAIGVITFTKIFFIPILSPFGDFLPKKKLYLCADIYRGVLFSVFAILSFLNCLNIYLISAIYVLISVADALETSVAVSIIPELVDEDKVHEAMRRGQVLTSMSQIIISLTSGLVLSFAGISISFIVNAVSFFSAALLISRIVLKKECYTYVKDRVNFKNYFGALKSAIIPFTRNFLFIGVVLIISLINFASYPLAVFLPLLVKQYGTSPVILGFLNSGLTLGFLIGAITLKRLSGVLSKDKIIVFGILMLGTALMTLSVTDKVFLNICSLFLFGFGLIIANLSLTPVLLMAVPNNIRSRISSFLDFGVKILNPLSLFCAACLITRLGISHTILLSGLFVIIVAPFIIFVPGFISVYKKDYKSVTSNTSAEVIT